MLGRRHLALFALFGVLSSACFVVTDLNRFKEQAPQEQSNFSDLRVTLRGMTSHVAERVEYRVVDASNVIQSRGIIIPLGGPDASFFVERAVPKQNGPFHFDFYADHDNSGGYDPRPDTFIDHAWRLQLDSTVLDDSGTYVVIFDHNTSFTNLNTPTPATEFGKNATVHMKDMGQFHGKRVEVRISDASTQRTVAMYRVPVVENDYDVLVPGMIEAGVTYSIEIYTDDAKGGSIRAFRMQASGADTGLEATFNGTPPAETGAAPVSDPQPVQ